VGARFDKREIARPALRSSARSGIVFSHTAQGWPHRAKPIPTSRPIAHIAPWRVLSMSRRVID
jgi:hypothetical protein